MVTIRQSLENLVETESVFDPHGNIRQYMATVENPTEEMDKLARLLDRFVAEKLSPKQHEILYLPNQSDTKKLEILTKLAMHIPFDYMGNAIKTAKFMRAGNIPDLDETLLENKRFYYLRTPTEVLEDYFKNGTGGDCFSTSFLTQILFSVHGIESKIVLCYDKKEDRDKPEKKHHCAVLAKADGKDFYIDTSLNVEVPAEYRSGERDLGDKSSIFRLIISEKEEEQYQVSYKPKASPRQGLTQGVKTMLRNLSKGPVNLWYFKHGGNPLSEVLPSMLHTLHPEVPPSKENKLNRNNQIRANALRVNGKGEEIRERVFYDEAQGSYLSRPTINQMQKAGQSLGVTHDRETGLIEQDGANKLAHHINEIFGIKPEITLQAVDSLNYINSRVRENE